jgi:hypothetical protein
MACKDVIEAGIAQLGEPDKEITLNVSFPGERYAMDGVARMSYGISIAPWMASKMQAKAGVAQLVEQLICNQPVGGSNPLASSIYII